MSDASAPPSHALAYAMLVGVMSMWASGVVVARSVHTLVPPIGFSFWRWCVAALALTPLALSQALRRRDAIRARGGRCLLLGMFIAGGSTLLVWSVQYTTATNAALVSAAQPTVTALIAWLLLDERLRPAQVAGVLAAAAGVVAMVVKLDLGLLWQMRLNPGDLLVSLAVVFYALYSVNLHKWLGGLPPLVMMYLSALGGVVALLPFYLCESVLARSFEPRLESIAATVFMGLVPTLTATTLWNMSVGAVGVNRASAFINLLPLFGALFATLLLDEALHAYHVIGAALVCAGITLVVRAAPRRATRA